MIARGNTRIILKKVKKIQMLVGEAKSKQDDDRDSFGHSDAQKLLEGAFDLRLEIRSMYDPT